MKKLIIGVAAVAFAATVHAASAAWGLEKDSAKTFGNLTAYVINGSDYATVTALLTTGGDSVATDFNGYVIDSVALNSRGAGSSIADGMTGTSLAWFIFADDKIQDGSSYSTTGAMDVSAYVYTPPASSPGEFMFTVDSFTTRGAPIGNVPEPTSGLLMLLGMAGLALRRRRA